MTHEETRALMLRYLRALSGGGSSAALVGMFDPAIVAEEMPNALAPKGARRTLPELLAAHERGQKAMRDQRYEALRIAVDGSRVAMEVVFTGVLAVAAGPFPEGHTLSGRSALFLEVRDGRITKLTNYDCFD